MRRLVVAVVAGLALAAASTNLFAQAKPGAATQKPAAAAPAAQKPAAPAAQAAAPRPSLPFPEGAKIAFINIQQIAASSAEGKASSSKVTGLRDKKLGELAAMNKQLEAAQAKVNQGVLSEEARAAAQKDVEKLNVDIQRKQQDAEAELTELQQQLQQDFQRKLSPIIQQLATEKGLQILLSQVDAGIVWADPAIDLTAEVVKRFDAAAAGAAK